MRKKQRLTITLPPPAIEIVDSVIDGMFIRNRSQAIESLINQGFVKTVETAVILSGGAEEHTVSRVLKKVNGQYLLAIMIEQLKKHGIKKIVLCAGSGTESIRSFFGDGTTNGIVIEYIQERIALGTAGVLLAAKEKILGSTFVLLYGDILTNIDFKDLITFHFSEGNMATMGIKPRMGEKKYGQVSIQGNSVVGYSKKESNTGLGLVNTGIYIFSIRTLDLIPKNTASDLDAHLIPSLIAEKQLSAFIFQGIWHDISAKNDLSDAESRWG